MNASSSISAIFSPQLIHNVKLGAQPLELASGYRVFMDVHEIRRRNLAVLVSEIIDGGLLQKDAALALDLSPSYLSQLLGGKLMGSDVARGIEKARNLAPGWMDLPKWSIEENSPPGYLESHVAGFDLAILGQAMQLLELVLGITGDPPEMIKDPWCIQQAYFVVAHAMRSSEGGEQEMITKLAAPLASRLRERKPSDAANVTRRTEEPGAENGGRHQRRAGRKN